MPFRCPSDSAGKALLVQDVPDPIWTTLGNAPWLERVRNRPPRPQAWRPCVALSQCHSMSQGHSDVRMSLHGFTKMTTRGAPTFAALAKACIRIRCRHPLRQKLTLATVRPCGQRRLGAGRVDVGWFFQLVAAVEELRLSTAAQNAFWRHRRHAFHTLVRHMPLF